MSANLPPAKAHISYHTSPSSDFCQGRKNSRDHSMACQIIYADKSAGMALAIQESIEQVFGENAKEDRSENGGAFYQFRMPL